MTKKLRRAPLRVDVTNTLNRTKTPVQSKIDKKKNSLISQEIKIARLLANNDKKVRDRVFKRMKKWLTVRSQDPSAFTKLEFMSLWKGLFYYMWMSDKMLVQEELAESLAKLVHCFSTKNTIVLYTSCALKTLTIEWFGIDQYRMDKFLMLVRRILRQTFVVCKDKLWSMEWVREISLIFQELLTDPKTPVGFNLHFTDIYLEELAKISDGNLPEDAVCELVKPFISYLVTSSDQRQIKHVTQHIFNRLMFQSDVGLNYIDKFSAWRKAGFPCAKLSDMQRVEISDTEDDFDNEQYLETYEDKVEKLFDPRAGRVDVELPQIPFDAAKLADLLSQYRFHPSSTANSRKRLLKLVSHFRELSRGNMPLGMKVIEKPDTPKRDINVRNAALRLLKFEKKLFSDKLTGKQKRKRKRESTDTVNESFLDSSKDENIPDQNHDVNGDEITSETNEADDTIVKTSSEENAVPPKKRKKSNLTRDKLGDKRESAKGRNAESRIPTNDTTKENIKCKTKKAAHPRRKAEEGRNSESRIPTNDTEENVKCKTKKAAHPQRKAKRNAKPAVKSALSESKLARDRKKNAVLSSRVTKRTCSNPLLTKKKVMFRPQNIAHYKSDYLQQIRKSPGVPFDANKQPLHSVLKTSPIPSPINPFYKKRLT